MNVLNFIKNSILAGFFSEKAFSELKKKNSMKSSFVIFTVLMLISFLFLGIVYSLPGTLEQEISGFGIDTSGGISLWVAWVYSLIMTGATVLYFFMFVFFSKIFLGSFSCVEKKPKRLKDTFQANVVVMVASVVPSILFMIGLVLAAISAIFYEWLALVLIVLILLGLFIYFGFLYAKVYSELFNITSLWKSFGIFLLSLIVSYTLFIVLFLVFVVAFSAILYSLI